MKKINFVIICLIYCLNSVAQDTANKNNLMTFSVPQSAKKLTKDQFLTNSHQRFKRRLAPENNDRFYKNVYSVDDVLVSVYDWDNLDDKRTMQQIQGEMKGMNSLGSRQIKQTKMSTINGIQYLIFEFQDDDDFSFWFLSELKNRRRIQGFLQFKQADEAKAQKVLDTLLQSMKFKQQVN